MASAESFLWHCSCCGRLNGKRHDNCPTCRQHWIKGIPRGNTPKSPRTNTQTARTSNQQSQWDWKTGNTHKSKPKGKGDQSESARRRKGKGKGNQGQQGSAQPFALCTAACPNSPLAFSRRGTIRQSASANSSITCRGELGVLVCDQEALSRYQPSLRGYSKDHGEDRKVATKALSNDLNKASKQVGQAARQVSTVKDALWLKHLKDSVISWQKQLQLFKDQQHMGTNSPKHRRS